MSHSHRDDHELVTPASADAAASAVAPAGSVVSNTEAERRAAERRRKAEAPLDQATEHEFTGDLPEPSRGGGTETETLHRIEAGDDDDVAAVRPAASRRGPPAPRALHVDDEASWVAPAAFDAASLSSAASWAKR